MATGVRTISVLLGCAFLIASTKGVAGDSDFLVRFSEPTSVEEAQEKLAARGAEVVRVLVEDMNLYLARPVGRQSARNLVNSLNRTDSVSYAQEDHDVSLRVAPNDEEYAKQWALKNDSGTADIRAEAAWKIVTGVREGRDAQVVAVVDGGVDTKHPDLAGNLWKNTAEIAGNKKDDDGNGYVDDVEGWNAYKNDGSIPANKHGTHVAGIIGARGNNESFISGVNWRVKIMPVAASSTKTSVVAAGYGYVIKMKKLYLQTKGAKGANIVATNSSFGVDYADCTDGEYPVWNDLFDEMGKYGILSAAATANKGINIDDEGDVPTGCKSKYLVTVTNTDRNDKRNPDSAFGKESVQIAAPGTKIWSLLPDESSGSLTGTSMSTPHIAGAIALVQAAAPASFQRMRSAEPGKAAQIVKAILLATVDKIAELKDKTVSGGRLNLAKAVQTMAAWNGKGLLLQDLLVEFLQD